MYVISETITSANQIFTYDVTNLPVFAVDSSWEIESVNSIPDGSSCLVADASIVDEKTFTLKPCNADFSAYVLINLVFLDKVKINRRRRAIELRVDFTTHYIDKAIYITTSNTSPDDNLTVHFREPEGEFHYCIVGRDDTLPDITGDWNTVTGVTSVRMTGTDHKMWIYTTKNEKYSVSSPIHVEIDDTHWDPYTGDDKGYNVGGDIYGLLAGGKIGQIAALENVFAGEDIERCLFDLTETNLTEGCYLNLFGSSGVWADSTVFQTTLPATVVPSHAYYAMFRGIRYLYGPSSIDASALTGTHNFTAMFQSCNSIKKYPKDLKPRVLTPYCYSLMFNNTGVTPAEITIRATEYAEGCFNGMFASCYGTPNGIWSHTKPYSHASICELNETRALPPITATDFYEHSFEKAFADCRYIYASRALTMNIHKALERAFYKAFTLESWSSTSGIDLHSINTFTNTYTGEIELGTDAFRSMFSYCKNLNNVKNMSLASRSDAQNAYRDWLFGCSSTGTYTYNYYLLEHTYPTYTQADAETLIRSDYYIPSGWNIVLEDPVTRDYTFEFATGYPETIDGSLGDVNLGFYIGDGYDNYDRKLTIYCKDQNDASIFYNEYIINSGSYTETPYIVRINPNITQNDWNFDVSTSLTFYRCGGIADVENITQNISIPVDSNLMWETGYPKLATEGNLGAIDLSLYIGDGYNGCARTLNIVGKDGNNSATLFSQTYNITGSYTETPYNITINPSVHSYDWAVNLTVTATFGSVQQTIYGEVSLPIDKTFSWGTNYPSLAVDGSLGTVNLGYLVGKGYPGYYDRVLTVTATDQDNTELATRTVTLSRSGNYTQNPYTLSFNTLAYPDTTKVNINSTMVFNRHGSQESAYLDTYQFTIPLPEFNYKVSKRSSYCSWKQTGSTATSKTGKLTVGLDIQPGCPTGKKMVINTITRYDTGDIIQTSVNILDPSSTTESLQYDINITFKTAVRKLRLTSEVHFRDSKDTKDLHVTTVTGTTSV